jgi:tRNA C32,U32 (ribose-2'-O)-methylase TrmJ
VVKDLILDVDLFPLMFDVLKCDLKVLIEETLEFHILNEAILVLIDLFEELKEVFTLQRDAKQVGHLRLHVLESEETHAFVHQFESLLSSCH